MKLMTLILATIASAVTEAPSDAAGTMAERQLAHAVGNWSTTTQFLGADGSVAREVEGTYEFEWVVPGKVVSGVSAIPTLDQRSGILFYHRPATKEIEMVSVGPDGALWVMTGPEDGEVRETRDRPMADGSTMKLRFTRYNVEADRFESKMEYSSDGGKSWTQGNHQVFIRRPAKTGD